MTNTEDVTNTACGVSIAALIIARRKKCILSAKNCREFFALVIQTTEVERSLMKIKKVGRVSKFYGQKNFRRLLWKQNVLVQQK